MKAPVENTFLKKDSATGFSQKIFWNLKKNILSGGLLLEVYEPVTALSALQNNWSQTFCKFPNKFVRAMKFFFKELFFSSKTFIRNNPITGIF